MKFPFFILLTAIVFSAPANSAEWTAVSANHHATFFVDENSIKKKDGYVFYWDMGNLLGPIGEGVVSISSFNKADCKNFLVKTLKTSFHKMPMANDKVEVLNTTKRAWTKPSLSSASSKILKYVCNM